MLKISGTGWAKISIDNQVVYTGSYLTDIPCDFMKALYDYCSKDEIEERDCRRSSSVYVDSEGGVANFVFSDMIYSQNDQKVFMFYSGKNGWEFKAFNADPVDLTKELVRDIESDFENWVEWYCNEKEPAKKAARDNLSYWLNKLKEIIAIIK